LSSHRLKWQVGSFALLAPGRTHEQQQQAPPS
jgi:hypothetical protein